MCGILTHNNHRHHHQSGYYEDPLLLTELWEGVLRHVLPLTAAFPLFAHTSRPLVGQSLKVPPFAGPIQDLRRLADQKVQRILVGNRQVLQNGVTHLHAIEGLALFAVLLLLDESESKRLLAEAAAPEGAGIGHIRAETAARAVLPVPDTGPK